MKEKSPYCRHGKRTVKRRDAVRGEGATRGWGEAEMGEGDSGRYFKQTDLTVGKGGLPPRFCYLPLSESRKRG